MFSLNRYIKFLIVGAIGVIINYMIYYPVRDKISFIIFGFYIDPAWFFGIAISASCNYLLNEAWTFNESH